MVRIIYGDVLLLIDFCMNFFVLYTTGIIMRRQMKIVCICLASLIGGIYSVIKVFISGNDVLDCVISFCVGLLICYICFGGYRFLKSAAIFYSVASLVGGMMIGIYFLLGSFHTDIYGYAIEYAYSHMPIWMFIILAAISMIISWAFAYFGREHSEKREEEIFVEYRGRNVKMNVLLDSGNLVKEPISGKNVIIIVKSKAEILLGNGIYSSITNKDTEKLLKNGFRIITVTGIDGKRCTHYGVAPDRMYMIRQKKKINIDAYVAVCESETLFGDCDGLAHPALFS